MSNSDKVFTDTVYILIIFLLLWLYIIEWEDENYALLRCDAILFYRWVQLFWMTCLFQLLPRRRRQQVSTKLCYPSSTRKMKVASPALVPTLQVRQQVSLKHCYLFTKPQCVTSQNTVVLYHHHQNVKFPNCEDAF